MADLHVKINNLQLKNPVLTASGTFGYGLEFADFIPLDGLGGFIVKVRRCARVRAMIIPVWWKPLRVC